MAICIEELQHLFGHLFQNISSVQVRAASRPRLPPTKLPLSSPIASRPPTCGLKPNEDVCHVFYTKCADEPGRTGVAGWDCTPAPPERLSESETTVAMASASDCANVHRSNAERWALSAWLIDAATGVDKTTEKFHQFPSDSSIPAF